MSSQTDDLWYVQHGDSAVIGPVATDLLIKGIASGRVPLTARLCPVGGREWSPVAAYPQFVQVAQPAAQQSPVSSGPKPNTKSIAESPDEADALDLTDELKTFVEDSPLRQPHAYKTPPSVGPSEPPTEIWAPERPAPAPDLGPGSVFSGVAPANPQPARQHARPVIPAKQPYARAAVVFSITVGAGLLLVGTVMLVMTLQKAADDPAALAASGFKIFDSDPPDEMGAFPYFARSCDLGDPTGCTGLGLEYLGNKDIRTDYDKASKLFEGACAKKAMRACAALGVVNYFGWGRPVDHAKGLALWQQACDGGEPRGCYKLGVVYSQPDPQLRDVAHAITLLKRACSGGYKKACSEAVDVEARAALPADTIATLKQKCKAERFGVDDDECSGKELPTKALRFTGCTFSEIATVAQSMGCQSPYPRSDVVRTWCCPSARAAAQSPEQPKVTCQPAPDVEDVCQDNGYGHGYACWGGTVADVKKAGVGCQYIDPVLSTHPGTAPNNRFCCERAP